MLSIISNKKQIAECHSLFHKKLYTHFTNKVWCRVGYPGGSFEDDVYYSPDLDLWICDEKLKNRFWNGFGHGTPTTLNSNSISGEINFPYQGINRRVAGAFAIEQHGNILVLHRGKIGGGKPGRGKNLFPEHFRGDKVIAIDGDRDTEFCLVGELNSPLLHKQVETFVSEMRRIKHLGKKLSETDFANLNKFQYTSESFGESEVEKEGTSIINRTHGIVVDALVKELQKRGHLVANDKNRDLFIYQENKINILFEIKTSSSSQCIYQAVGQLLIYSIPIKNPVHLVSVFPKKLSRIVEERISIYGIKPLYYHWHEDEPQFIGLDEILFEKN